ncbi:uncharacterized protein [Miscanthus floridulus]|uniref:uncharacterized protein n=1 Tax=Miscanthus floridulus TaxID=154761 RepID=UPI0034577741
MGELAATTSPPPPASAAAVVPVVFVDGEQSVDLGTVTVQPSLGGVKRLQAVVADRVGVAPHQISASLARPRRARRVPLDDATDLAAAVAREGNGCYVVAGLRRSRRGGRSRRDRKGGANGAAGAGAVEKTILKRLPPTDLASLVGPPPPLSLALPHAGAAAPPLVLDGWGYDDYEARLRELQRQRDWYLVSTAGAGPDPSYFHLAAAAAGHPEHEDPAALWSPRLHPSPCPECEAAAAAMRQPAFHWCVRDAVVSAGFRSHVGPIERPPKKTPSPPPTLPLPSPGRLPGLLGMPVY